MGNSKLSAAGLLIATLGGGLWLGLVLAGQPALLALATGAVGGVLLTLLVSLALFGLLFGSAVPRGALLMIAGGGFVMCAAAAYFSVSGAGG